MGENACTHMFDALVSEGGATSGTAVVAGQDSQIRSDLVRLFVFVPQGPHCGAWGYSFTWMEGELQHEDHPLEVVGGLTQVQQVEMYCQSCLRCPSNNRLSAAAAPTMRETPEASATAGVAAAESQHRDAEGQADGACVQEQGSATGSCSTG